MRISDWSSDVCSSDLVVARGVARGQHQFDQIALQLRGEVQVEHRGARGEHVVLRDPLGSRRFGLQPLPGALSRQPQDLAFGVGGRVTDAHVHQERSEEHTSELQSLMRISSAVFCLKKKKKYNKI